MRRNFVTQLELWSTIRSRFPLPVTIILFVALALTLLTKLSVVSQLDPERVFLEWVVIILPDISFFAIVFLCVKIAFSYKPSFLIIRCGLLLSSLLLIWSILNSSWMMATGVQLRPGILWVLLHDPSDFWPIVESRIVRRIGLSILVGTAFVAGTVWFWWQFANPRSIPTGRRFDKFVGALTGIVILLIIPINQLCTHYSSLGAAGKVLGFNSHWYAIVCFVNDIRGTNASVSGIERRIARVGERRIEPPEIIQDDLPNIVIVLLESTSYRVTGLGEGNKNLTPNLNRLAAAGTEFVYTYVPAAQTTKAVWSTMTAVYPDSQPGFKEAVLSSEPYEGLPSILGSIGYRSAIFEMTKGSFQSAPSLMANVGFQWAWFRENLEDPTSYLGYFGGDDYRVFNPIFNWASESSGPFLLTVITTVSHDPFELPDWYEPEYGDEDPYMQCIRFGDEFLGELCRRFDEMGMSDNTVFCVLGDHGESHRPGNRNGRAIPYEEVVRVPWVMYCPGRVPSGRRVNWTCSQLDVTPTVLNLLGFDISKAGFEGRDAYQPALEDRRLYFWSWSSDSPMGVLQGRKKWIYWPYKDLLVRFDLLLDPKEENPEIVVGIEKKEVVADFLETKDRHQINVPVDRFCERLLYDHWRTFCSGHNVWSYYVP